MPASCKCTNGHAFNSRILEDDHTTNSFVIADDVCPDCGAEVEVVGVEDDRYDDDVI